MMRKGVVITFHRHYNIYDDEIMKRVEELYGLNAVVDNNLYQEVAETIARERFEDESSHFAEDSRDFVSLTKELMYGLLQSNL